MKIKSLLFLLFASLFCFYNFSSADVISQDPCNYHNYEIIEKMPEGYVLLERYINGDKTIDKVFDENETLTRIGGEYGEGDYELYLIPESEKTLDTEGRVGSDWIVLSDSGLTTVKKRKINQGSYLFGETFHCYPLDKEYLYEISLKGDDVVIQFSGERKRENTKKHLSHYELIYAEKYQIYKTREFILAYLLTILSETFILRLIAKNFIKEKPTTKKIILTGLMCSGITLPLLWFIFPLFLGNGIFYAVGGEILVLIIESIIIKYILNLSRLKSLLISFVCNLVSFLLGVFITSSDIKENIGNLLKALINLVFLILVFLYSAKKIKEIKEKNQIIMLSFFILAMVLLAFVGLALIEYGLFR